MAISEKGKKRYELIVKTALDLFLKNGYEKTSLSDIVAISGGSLASIYTFFESKEGLFQAIIEQEINALIKEIDEKIDLKISHSLEEFLTKFATIIFSIICTKKNISLGRIMMSEGSKNGGKLGRVFLDQILNRIDLVLINFFERDEVKAELNPKFTVKFAAKCFMKNVIGLYYFDSLMINKEPKLSKKEREEHVALCVELFLNGIIKK
ncbi:TetR/AcrR family transcriptional regulator [Campylobacter concisus]|uniref:TetR/AcrR family transcriptional regulator n=1 Tax=Campylobacter concisus TaxID=199 RepID=UPI000D3583F4|nr:TetR/AcrR family transcriptional regulator [Campylobacter concisus]QPH93044.1 TetR/AcrR family transcriptional regulator [Campylobacter concisus]